MIVPFNAALANDYLRILRDGFALAPLSANRQWSDEELFTLLGVIASTATDPMTLGEAKWKAANDEQREAMAQHAMKVFAEALEHVWFAMLAVKMGNFLTFSENRLVVSLDMAEDGSIVKTVLQGEKKPPATSENA